MRTKMTKKMPTSGQFVAVWIFNNLYWSSSYVWEEEKLFEFCVIGDQEIKVAGNADWDPECSSLCFFQTVEA